MWRTLSKVPSISRGSVSLDTRSLANASHQGRLEIGKAEVKAAANGCDKINPDGSLASLAKKAASQIGFERLSWYLEVAYASQS